MYHLLDCHEAFGAMAVSHTPAATHVQAFAVSFETVM